MGRLFVGNFDFERELVHNGPAGRILHRLNQELTSSWLAVATEVDYLLWQENPDEEFLDSLKRRGVPLPRPLRTPTDVARAKVVEIVPWGWSARLLHLAQTWAPHQKPVSPDMVAWVNSRHFSAGWERETGTALPWAGPISNLTDLQNQLKDYEARTLEPRWLIKANWGQAGRERLVGRGSQLADRDIRWIQTRLNSAGAVFLEPFVESVAEAGIQWTIPRQGTPRLDAVIPLMSTPQGGYWGSEVMAPEESLADWDQAIEVQCRVVEEIQRLGYWGPVGIDAMWYRFGEGEVRLRPIQDINARWTMGRIAHAWGQRLGPAGGLWIHSPWSVSEQAIATSPRTLAEIPVRHQTWWVDRSNWPAVDRSSSQFPR
jgi:hypothetical protein